jgi:hypothetical protein
MRKIRFQLLRTLLPIVAISLVVAPQAVATLSVYVPPEDLARSAPLVVEGVVESVRSGLDPENGGLATYITLSIDHVHRGPADLEEVVVREMGGRFGDWIHHVDAVPVYVPGERVLAFLEPAPDGALRTSEMFFGKFRLDQEETGVETASRDLSGHGLILGRLDSESVEEFSSGDLAAVVATHPVRRGMRGRARWTERPPEYDRLQWPGPGSGGPGMFSTEFTPLNPAAPVRWTESDSGSSIVVNVERAGNPLDDGDAAVYEMVRAMEAWTNVSESRVHLTLGDGDAQFTASHPDSPSSAPPYTNIMLFDDPYGDISSSGCGGTLAVGGYWAYGSPIHPLNNVNFHPAAFLYVIFDNNDECILGDPDDLAEVATHELGHGLGFGHSTVSDSIMRAFVYRNRGPRLGDDDCDIAHCHYPHTLSVLSPTGGESWAAGTSQEISWSVSSEQGPDPGVVDLELSTNGGSDWTTISAGEWNDGSYTWTVPDQPTTSALIRVTRYNRLSPPSPYPDACSSAASGATFEIGGAAPLAGQVPDGSSGTPLEISHAGGADLDLTWGASCSAQADAYAVYEGSLPSLWSGVWDHAPVTCAAGLAEPVTPAAGPRYFLVAPLAAGNEGSLGVDSWGTERPVAAAACGIRETASCP